MMAKKRSVIIIDNYMFFVITLIPPEGLSGALSDALNCNMKSYQRLTVSP